MPVTESVVLPPNFKVDTLWNNLHPRKGAPLLSINLSEMQIGRRKFSKKRTSD